MLSEWSRKGIAILLWFSTTLQLNVLFALGVLFAFPTQYRLRRIASVVIAIQVFFFLPRFFIELHARFSDEALEYWTRIFNSSNVSNYFQLSVICSLVVIWFANFVFALLRSTRRAKLGRLSSSRKKLPDASLWLFTKGFLGIIVFTLLTINFQENLRTLNTGSKGFPVIELYEFGVEVSLSAFFVFFYLLTRKPMALFAPLWAKWERGNRAKRTLLRSQGPQFGSKTFREVWKRAKIRNRVFPGFGLIYLGDYWRGFPLLFVYLLLVLFSFIWIFSFLSPVVGIQFLALLGLKPGIPDKDFFLAAKDYTYLSLSVLGLFLTYFLSERLFRASVAWKLPLVSNTGGLRRGFQNALPISLLVHLILLAVIIIIPISIQRNQNKKSKSEATNHFQPEKMEFYFIDPNIPDDTKGLNGGVVTGNDTTFQESGEKISNEKTADNGPKTGFIKKIRGKKLPPTYSNYISAKMRIPESFMDYWAKAPHPYSAVVAYTITQDGDVVDIELVEGSPYPEFDIQTLTLVENLGPLIPPPDTKGDIRVTELFWNGPVDPSFVSTPLQKEMILMFDGRYMEEIPE